MAKGCFTWYGSWKQPICYYFSKSGLSKIVLKQIITEVITALQSIGLNVVSIVCDQNSNNRSAYNLLTHDTNSSYIRNGQEYRLRGFEVNGQEVIPLFDVPRLIKGMRDSFFGWKCTI